MQAHKPSRWDCIADCNQIRANAGFKMALAVYGHLRTAFGTAKGEAERPRDRGNLFGKSGPATSEAPFTYRASSTRLEIPSFSKMWKIEFFTVLSLIFSAQETSRLLIPSATNCEISSSRGLSRTRPVASVTCSFDFERPSKISGKSARRTHTSPRDTQSTHFAS
jgi:hypothetical protein